MKKSKMYFYVGTNGTLTTAIHIKGADGVVYYKLEAGKGKKLTKDDENFVEHITVPEEEVSEWKEVDDK